jgi:hypothetical protein
MVNKKPTSKPKAPVKKTPTDSKRRLGTVVSSASARVRATRRRA